MDDELFKNLQIKDIEELFKEQNSTPKGEETPEDQDSPAIQSSSRKPETPDCQVNEKLENDNKFFLSDEDALLLDRNDDSPGHQLEEENEIDTMDFEHQMKLYEEMNDDIDLNKPRNSTKEGDLFNKFKIQSLEEVTERSEESDITSHMSFNSSEL